MCVWCELWKSAHGTSCPSSSTTSLLHSVPCKMAAQVFQVPGMCANVLYEHGSFCVLSLLNCFCLAVISTDLRQQEAYAQIFDALDYLNNVCDDVFKRVGNRVAHEKGRIQHVNARLSVAQVCAIHSLRHSLTHTLV